MLRPLHPKELESLQKEKAMPIPALIHDPVELPRLRVEHFEWYPQHQSPVIHVEVTDKTTGKKHTYQFSREDIPAGAKSKALRTPILLKFRPAENAPAELTAQVLAHVNRTFKEAVRNAQSLAFHTEGMPYPVEAPILEQHAEAVGVIHEVHFAATKKPRMPRK